VYADADVVTVDAESDDNGEAGYTFRVNDGIEGLDVGTVHVRFFYNSGLELGDVALADGIAGAADLSIADVATEVDPATGVEYVYCSAYVTAKEGTVLNIADGSELVKLTLAATGRGLKAATLGVQKFDVVYYEDGYEGGAVGLPAEETLSHASATTELLYLSKFDIDMDGAVTLVDVDLVRASMGQDPAAVGASVSVVRSDLAAPIGTINPADLAVEIIAYELTL
jgi:hypothetical protein